MANITERKQLKYVNDTIIGRIYKLLPIYEGKDIKSGDLVVSPDLALEAFLKQLVLLETSIKGLNAYSEDKKYYELLFLIAGMKEFDIGQHDEVKICTFRALELCKSLINKYGV